MKAIRIHGPKDARYVEVPDPKPGPDDYADCPCADPADTGHACQVYVDDGALGGFAELEFHGPALLAGERESASTNCTAWGFIGSAAANDQIQSTLPS